MKQITYRCDCCNKDISKDIDYANVRMPIVSIYEDKKYLKVQDMDLCIECANKFSKLYYEIANENNYSGIIVLNVDREEGEEE